MDKLFLISTDLKLHHFLMSSSNPSPSWNIFNGSSVKRPLYSGTRCVVKLSHGTISVSLRTFSTKTLKKKQRKSTSDFQEGMQPFSAVREHLPQLFNNQSQSDLVPLVMQTWCSIAIWTKICKTHKKQDQCDYFH